MSFAELRRLRRRPGLTNAERLAEGYRRLAAELASLSGSTDPGRRPPASGLVASAGLTGDLRREVEWAAAAGERLREGFSPTAAEVERFFDAVEWLFGADLATPLDPRELIGATVGGRYRIEAVVGEGSAGVVYRARHVETDALVAVKLLHPSKVLRREIIGELEHPRRFWGELVARFRREARTAAAVNHPGIALVFDFGAEGTGFYQAMEFLTGETLKELIAREGAIAVPRAVGLIHAAAAALDAAHARGVVHRDLKPANLFLCRFDWGETLKLLDFGIAKMVRDAEEEATRLTETGVFVGTYRYASPEQCLGDAVTPASDVYALAVTLFELVAGRPPFDGPSSVLAIKHATARPPRLDEFRPEVPSALADVVERALSKEPSARQARGGALADDLAPFLADQRAASGKAAPRPAGRERAPAPAAGQLNAATSKGVPAATRDPRSFADLLIREILQFFPEAVAQGRAAGDIYRRLHGEIDLRWSIYSKRYPDEPVDHFYEQLVERLGGGDVTRLGPGLPHATTDDRRRRRHQPNNRQTR
jgi:hypothetical protein